MAGDIGSATVRVTPNMTGIQSKIASGFKGAAGPATAALGDEVEKNSGPFQSALGKLGGFAKGAGVAIGAGLLAGAAGLATITGKALMAGAELEQQLGGSEAVFGEYAASIQSTAADAFKNAGLSQNEFLQGANKMGSLFQGAGFDVQSSMKMSADSMQRASDVASIMGIDTTSALEAVTGMAKGNFTMMDNLGVAMNDTSIQAYALSKGIDKSTAAMTIQEKVGLAQEMFMQKTAKYAGNYAKENDTLAGSINTTKKAFQDFMSTGNVEGFVESLVKTIKIAVPQIIALLPKLVDGISQILGAVVPALSAALPVLIPALIKAATDLILAIVKAMPQIVQALVGAMPVLIDAFIKLFLAILQALPKIITMLTAAIPQIVDALVVGLTTPEAITAIIMGAIQLLMAILLAIPVIITALVKALPEVARAIFTTLTSKAFMDQMFASGVQFMKSMITGVVSMYGQVFNSVGHVLDTISKILSPSALARIGGDMIRGLWNGISDLTGWINSKLKGFGDSVLKGIKDFFGIHSPSTVFADIGHNLDRGLAQGIQGSAGLVSKAVDTMSESALASMTANPNITASMSTTPMSTIPASAFGSTDTTPQIIQNNDIYNQVDLDKVSRDLAWQVRR